MRRIVLILVGTWAAWMLPTGRCLAGMPTPMWVLTDEARPRVDAISFFLLVILLCALCVRWLWNGLCRDFPQWPRITYRGSLSLCLVWGLFFTVVLTMISGARELMTPGAWKRSGATYELNKDTNAAAQPASLEVRRREKLARLRDALWQFADAHEGKLPDEPGQLPDLEVWNVPDGMGMQYLYCAGERIGEPAKIVAFEPGLYDGDCLVLSSDREITAMSYPALKLALGSTRPYQPPPVEKPPQDHPAADPNAEQPAASPPDETPESAKPDAPAASEAPADSPRKEPGDAD